MKQKNWVSHFHVEHLKLFFFFFCDCKDFDSCGPLLSELTVQWVSFQHLYNYFCCWDIVLVLVCVFTINLNAMAGGCWVWSRPECWKSLWWPVLGCRTVEQGRNIFFVEEQDASKLLEAGQTHAVAKPHSQKHLFRMTLVPISHSKNLMLLAWKES